VEGQTEGTNAGSRGTASLREDIEAVKRRAEKYAQRKQLGADTGIEESRQALVKCYRENLQKPLDCWREVENFKKQVETLEAVSYGSVHATFAEDLARNS
jgi:altered-inheritance-of-mitochondria protein 13